MKSIGIVCQGCGIEAPCRYVEYYQNIGALVMRFHRSIKGNLCKRCVHRHFWKMTGTTLAVGWLGMISLLVTPIFVLNNLFRYLSCLGMPPVPPDAHPPIVNDEVFRRFLPQAQQFFGRIEKGEDLNDVARAMAPGLGITPGQVVRCAIVLVQQQRQQQQARTGGFPVLPVNAKIARHVPAVPVAAAPTTPTAAPTHALPAQAQPSIEPPPPQLGLGS